MADRRNYNQEPGNAHSLPEPAGLEVVTAESHPQPEYYANISEKYLHEPQKQAHRIDGPKLDQQHRPRDRRRWIIWLVGGLIIIGAIVGGVVGGVVGKRNSNDAKSEASSPPASSSSNTTTTSTAPPDPTPTQFRSIKHNSPLAATAWRKVNGVEIYLYYQGPDNVLRVASYDSGQGLPTHNNSYWVEPKVAAATAVPDTPIGATTIVWYRDFQPQIEIFYLSPPNYLLSGVNYNTHWNPPTQADAINSFNMTTHPESSIAAYWPSIIYQDVDNNIIEMRNDLDGYGKGTFSPSGNYFARNLGVKSLQGSDLAIVPLSTAYETSSQRGGYGVVYQKEDGSISAFVPDAGTTANVTRSWPSGVPFPDIEIPDGNAIEAFATARPDDSDKRTNTYILYQAADSAINMIWQDDETGWKSSRPGALARADNGTRIGCITMPSTHADVGGNPVLLEQASAETRCYFQRRDAVVEVQLNGTDWVELGTVPIP